MQSKELLATSVPCAGLLMQMPAGMVCRFAPNCYVGAETLYQTAFETEAGQERYIGQSGNLRQIEKNGHELRFMRGCNV